MPISHAHGRSASNAEAARPARAFAHCGRFLMLALVCTQAAATFVVACYDDDCNLVAVALSDTKHLTGPQKNIAKAVLAGGFSTWTSAPFYEPAPLCGTQITQSVTIPIGTDSAGNVVTQTIPDFPKFNYVPDVRVRKITVTGSVTLRQLVSLLQSYGNTRSSYLTLPALVMQRCGEQL